MVYYIGTVFVFHIQINWNFISMAIAFLAAIHRPLFTNNIDIETSEVSYM